MFLAIVLDHKSSLWQHLGETWHPTNKINKTWKNMENIY